mgnify:CR=1 FL=1
MNPGGRGGVELGEHLLDREHCCDFDTHVSRLVIGILATAVREIVGSDPFADGAATGLQRAESAKPRVDRLAEVCDDDQIGHREDLGGAVSASNSGLALRHFHDLTRVAVVLVPEDHPGPSAHGVLGQLNSLGQMFLEDEAESTLDAKELDLTLEVCPERRVIDLVEENVEFTSHWIPPFAGQALARRIQTRRRRRRQERLLRSRSRELQPDVFALGVS